MNHPILLITIIAIVGLAAFFLIWGVKKSGNSNNGGSGSGIISRITGIFNREPKPANKILPKSGLQPRSNPNPNPNPDPDPNSNPNPNSTTSEKQKNIGTHHK